MEIDFLVGYGSLVANYVCAFGGSTSKTSKVNGSNAGCVRLYQARFISEMSHEGAKDAKGEILLGTSPPSFLRGTPGIRLLTSAATKTQVFFRKVALNLQRTVLILTSIALTLTGETIFLTKVALTLTRVALFLTRVALLLTRVALFLTGVMIFLSG